MRLWALSSDILVAEADYCLEETRPSLRFQGLYQERPPLPYIPGSEVSGVVTEAGAGAAPATPHLASAFPTLASAAPETAWSAASLISAGK